MPLALVAAISREAYSIRPRPKPEFTLTDTSGQVYDFVSETDGTLTLLYFGYLNCPDICPVHLAQLAEVFDQVPAVARNTEVVFVTVDPERDTPAKIRSISTGSTLALSVSRELSRRLRQRRRRLTCLWHVSSERETTIRRSCRAG